MKSEYTIELLEEHEKVNLYVIHFGDESEDEFIRFIREYDSSKVLKKDLDIILTWIDKIGENGALERYFRPESSINDGICAIPI